MITIFNRKELCVTYDSKRQAEVRDILAGNGIDYRVKVINRQAASPFDAGTRARTGSIGTMNSSRNYEYNIYVHKEDYERAYSLISR